MVGSNFLCNFVAKINDINKMIKTMKHRDYMKPTMRVVKLRNSGMLMTSTLGVGATRGAYTHGRTSGSGTDEEVWE